MKSNVLISFIKNIHFFVLELSSLTTALPLEFSSAIFLQTDDDKPTIIRVLITGPEDTPYSGGCFLFDIFFPGTFPDKPPEVNFR